MLWVWNFAKVYLQFDSCCGPGVKMNKVHKILNEEVVRLVSDEVKNILSSNQYIRGKSSNDNGLTL